MFYFDLCRPTACIPFLTVYVLGELRVLVMQRCIKVPACRLSFSEADSQQHVALLRGGRCRLDPLQVELCEGAAGEQGQRHRQHRETQAATQAGELSLQFPL